ncbi:STAS domain-containing protein [Streptomyces sp. NPDC006172]|uniref:STAS domain-containing protein n=1 Tax=Streptomyces sp. NPDC006172 TaxID=3154470 RepID=UPI0033F71618
MSDVTVTTQQHPDRTLITVHGEIDLQSSRPLAQATASAPLDGKPLCLDLSGVPFMDSSGLNLLLLLRMRFDAEGGRLAVTGLQPQPTRLLQISGAYDLFTTDPDEISAILDPRQQRS